ncbi:hypothetical protein MHTCC0001_06270 [Flavobacteriaceae bacterium MHTCC 0001]
MLKSKEVHRFVYGFENKQGVTDKDIVKTIKILEKRLNNFGVQSEIQPLRNKHIEIIVKAHKLNVDRLNGIIINPGKLEFWELYKGDTFLNYFVELYEGVTDNDSVAGKSLFDLISSRGYLGGPVIFNFKERDTSYVDSLIQKKRLKVELNFDGHKVKFLWGKNDSYGDIPLYAAKSNRANKAPLTGDAIIKASHVFGVTGIPEVSMEMNEEGAMIWGRMTEKAFQNKTNIAIVLNDIVQSAPGVTSGGIRGGRSSISGNFTVEEAQDLAVILASGGTIQKLVLQEYAVVSN